ncbi:MAG: hypothetical protein HXY34_10620 [Candidatus Thorarchaeota archaeon]|nr:hypothetical protein [Candidatus Thorarchaeota archaeon]
MTTSRPGLSWTVLAVLNMRETLLSVLMVNLDTMNIISKARRPGSVNEVYKMMSMPKKHRQLSFPVARLPRDLLSQMLVVCGKIGSESIDLCRAKAKEIGVILIECRDSSWQLTLKSIRKHFDTGRHKGVLLLGGSKEIPSTNIMYQGTPGYTDWFLQDVDGDGSPDVPVGRVFGDSATLTYHMDPFIIDSNIAVVFDSQPGRSNRHVDALVKLGFDVEVLPRYEPDHSKLLGVSEFILQFSDGLYSSRIHGTPDMWATHNSLILSHEQAASIKFEGYPVVYSEACSTAREGALVKAFLSRGAAYIGSTLDTMNNTRPFDDWRDCAYADGYKFGFMDLLDSNGLIGQVKLGVDRAIFEHLGTAETAEIEAIRTGRGTELKSEKALSAIEWVMYGNPLRRTTVGPNADFKPGRIIVDT